MEAAVQVSVTLNSSHLTLVTPPFVVTDGSQTGGTDGMEEMDLVLLLVDDLDDVEEEDQAWICTNGIGFFFF